MSRGRGGWGRGGRYGDRYGGRDFGGYGGYGWYPKPAPKLPPPEHGLRMRTAGTSWWGARWIAALERLLPDGGRLQRGRSYARAGRVHDLEIHGGLVTAKVTGSRPEPYDVELKVRPLAAAKWEAALARIAAEARILALLVAGEMPRDVEAAFTAARASLFPDDAKDLDTDCSCPDWSNPCKHVAAVHYLLGEAFDRDPFLLFELRGRTKKQLLAHLAPASGGADRRRPKAAATRAPRTASSRPARDDPRAVAVVRRRPFDAPASPSPLDALRWSFTPPDDPAALLRALGNPPGWRPEPPIAAELAEVYARATRLASDLATGDNGGPSHPSPARTPSR